MMSHYGLPFEYDDHWICGALELSIETLAGTAFEIKVSPNDTIMAIKSKIQSVEGIPVSQQHLLYNLKELDNSASIRDYSIQNGATLKLVLSMRGGPISTKRLPPVDDLAWRDLQEFFFVTRKDDLFNKLPTGSRVTFLVFRDGDQVNLLRVVENEDGSFSPLSESWNGPSIRNLFAEEDPDESAKRLQENSVTMGKVQELKEKLETLSIQRKEKKGEDSSALTSTASPNALSSLAFADKQSGSAEIPNRTTHHTFTPGDCGRPNCLKVIRRTPEQEVEELAAIRPRSRLLSCTKSSMSGLSKARKEAENIIRMQSNLSILVDTEPNQGYRLRRTPLPDIHSSPRVEDDEGKSDDDEHIAKNLRGKTARASYAIVEGNDLATAAAAAAAAAAAGICSSRSSMVALPSTEQVAIAYTQIPREASATMTRSRFRVSRYVLDKEERPKTTPGKLDNEERSMRRSCESEGKEPRSKSRADPGEAGPRGERPRDRDHDPYPSRDPSPHSSPMAASERNPSCASTAPAPAPAPARPVPKKRLRCSHCKKKLNITNAHTCRCGRTFCSVHRYSEVHNCLFDYKEEGRKILEKTNPLVAASKLPKI